MKSVKFIAAILLLFSSLLFINCTPGEDRLSTQEIISRGDWSIDYFFAGQDQTSHYATYKFTFNANGSLSCSNISSHEVGDWQFVKNVENDVLNINLATQQGSLLVLNDHWTITGADMQSISLSSSSGQLRIRRN